VKLDALKTAHAERSEAVLMLQAAELALDSRAATVEIAPPLRFARNGRLLIRTESRLSRRGKQKLGVGALLPVLHAVYMTIWHGM
jgi:hypothetical protein